MVERGGKLKIQRMLGVLDTNSWFLILSSDSAARKFSIFAEADKQIYHNSEIINIKLQ